MKNMLLHRHLLLLQIEFKKLFEKKKETFFCFHFFVWQLGSSCLSLLEMLKETRKYVLTTLLYVLTTLLYVIRP